MDPACSTDLHTILIFTWTFISHPGCQISILYQPSAYRRRRTLLSNMKGIAMDEGGDGEPARNLNQAIEYFITFAQQHNSIA